MYSDFSVKIPDTKGKITIKKKGDASYVLYEYVRIYNSERHYNVPRRAIIGKVNPEDPSTMYPNESYQKYYPDTALPEERSEAYRSCCLRIGAYLVIHKILEEYHLPALLSKYIGNDCGLVLDLVSYLIVEEENVGQYYPDFAFNHPLFSDQMRIYSDSKVSRLLSSITTDQSIGFLNDWNEKRDHKQRIYVSYDSTNKNSQAGDIDILEFGKAKDPKGAPIFNLALAFDSTNRIPLFYEEYPGSINDVSQFSFMVDKVYEYGYKKMGFILDRGYFSKDNIREMEKNSYEFIIMVKGCKPLVSSLITSVKNSFETNRSCSIRTYKVYGTTVKANLFEDDRTEKYFHIYYNPAKQAAEREQLEVKIDRLKQFLQKNEGKEIAFGKTYTDYFTLHYNKNGVFLYADEKEALIRQELELCGYFCIITSEKMTAEEALTHYKGRDISEKLFRADKTFLGSKSMRVQSAEAMSAKIFIEFIALIVRNRLYNLLKEEMLRLETKVNFLTVPAALRELEKIEMVRRNNGKYRLDHAVTKKQKMILGAFGMDEEYVRVKASKISRLIDSGRALGNSSVEEENHGEEEIDIFD